MGVSSTFCKYNFLSYLYREREREREKRRENGRDDNNKLVFCSCEYIYGYHNIGVKIGIWYSGHTCKKGLYISPIYVGS